jgi:hypothetical protein
MIRRSPLTSAVSLARAEVLSLVWALASSFSNILTRLALIWDLTAARAGSTSMVAYHTSRKACSANPRIAVR